MITCQAIRSKCNATQQKRKRNIRSEQLKHTHQKTETMSTSTTSLEIRVYLHHITLADSVCSAVWPTYTCSILGTKPTQQRRSILKCSILGSKPTQQRRSILNMLKHRWVCKGQRKTGKERGGGRAMERHNAQTERDKAGGAYSRGKQRKRRTRAERDRGPRRRKTSDVRSKKQEVRSMK